MKAETTVLPLPDVDSASPTFSHTLFLVYGSGTRIYSMLKRRWSSFLVSYPTLRPANKQVPLFLWACLGVKAPFTLRRVRSLSLCHIPFSGCNAPTVAQQLGGKSLPWGWDLPRDPSLMWNFHLSSLPVKYSFLFSISKWEQHEVSFELRDKRVMEIVNTGQE